MGCGSGAAAADAFPGRPEPSRAVQREFWRLIATGITTVEASAGVGVSSPVGTRWFRHAGGMPPLSLDEPTGRYLSFAEREEIALLRAQDVGVREIARRIGRDPGTVSRELRRNAATRGGKPEYRALVAQWKAQQAAKRPKTAKLVDQRPAARVCAGASVRERPPSDGTIVAGPQTPAWKGLNKPHRAGPAVGDGVESGADLAPTRRSTSPMMSPCASATRRSTSPCSSKVVARSRRELVACLRTGRALREPRARSRNKPQGHVTADVVLSERPAEAADRAVPGHWEGDLIIGTGRSAIGTLVERTSRSTLLVHLPRLEGWGETPPVKNGPALGGYGAVAMNAALAASMTTLPEQLRKTLTWDRGKELSGHAQFTLDTGTKVFFADPHSPVAAAHEREHQRAAAPVLPERHRPVPLVRRGPRSRRPRPQQPTPQDPRLEDPGRSLRRTAYARSNSPVLHRPIELAQYLSIRYSERPADNDVVASVGSVGDGYDNAMAESFNGLFKWELIYPKGP